VGDATPGDGDLVHAVRAGDPAAFEILYRRHAPVVRRVVAAMLRQPDRVDDAVQDVFLRALERLSTLRDADRLAPWLKAIARNVATDRVRGRVDADIDGLAGEALVATSTSLDELTEIRELSRLVRGALTELSPRDVQAVTMAGFLDSSPAEIAEALGVSVGAAKVVLHRARGRLRSALKLELLVRRRGVACVEFITLADSGELVAAARHLVHCDACQRAGSAEIRLYELPRAAAVLARAVVRDVEGERTVVIRGRLVIGRECADVPADQRVVIDDPAVSRQHVEIRVDRATGHAYALDTSTNGTRLNGVRMERATPITLASGDTITVAAVEIEFHAGAPDAHADGGQRTTTRRAVSAPMVMAVGDIIGYTRIAERSGSGPLGDVLDQLYDELRLLLRAFGGTLGNIAGDAFFGVWELERDSEAPQRALDFALLANRVVSHFAPRAAIELSGQTRLKLGWAVSTGQGSTSVLTGTIATVVGDATNIAFRLASLAGRDGLADIVATVELADMARRQFDFGAPQDVQVKGRDAPVKFTPLEGRSAP